MSKELKVGMRAQSGKPPKQGVIRFFGETQVSCAFHLPISIR